MVAPPQVPGETQRTFVVTLYPVTVAGRLIGVGALVREVTEQRIAEQSRRHVLGVVGHDLRSPLMAITASAELLASGPLDERAARSVGRILRASGRMDGIIRALVDYTAVQGGPGIVLHPRRTELSSLLRAVAEECEAAHAGRTVRVTAPEPVNGEWDGDRIGQAVANLVGNALQYSPEDTPVEAACWLDGEAAVVEVTNAGAPIPAELVAHLFEPFRRGDDERTQRRKGLGLGLYIAVQIAAAHGGNIRVRSDASSGTTFSVRLPLALQPWAWPSDLSAHMAARPSQQGQRDLPAVAAPPVQVGQDVGERQLEKRAGAGGQGHRGEAPRGHHPVDDEEDGGARRDHEREAGVHEERLAPPVALGPQDGGERDRGGDLVGQDGHEDEQAERRVALRGAQREAVHQRVEGEADEGGQAERVHVAAGGLVGVVVPGVLPQPVGRRRRVSQQPLGGARLGADVDQHEALEQEEEEEPGHRPGDDVGAAQVDRLGEHVEEGRAQHDAGREGEQRVAAGPPAEERQRAAGQRAGQDGAGVGGQRQGLVHGGLTRRRPRAPRGKGRTRRGRRAGSGARASPPRRRRSPPRWRRAGSGPRP